MVPVAAFEAVGDDAAFYFFHEVEEAGVGAVLEEVGGVGGACELGWEEVGGDEAGGGKDDSALHRVFKLADVAWPLVVHEDAEGVGGEGAVARVVFFGIELQEVGGEEGDVFAAVAEGGELELDDVEAVEEVFAELAFANGEGEVDVGGGDDTDVYLDLGGAAEVHEAAVLQDA